MLKEYKWKCIDGSLGEFEDKYTYRMRIEGGCLYRHEVDYWNSDNLRGARNCMVFVPGPGKQHKGLKKRKVRRTAAR